MWCLVSQANSVILEVQVDPKAIGQECLEKMPRKHSATTYSGGHDNERLSFKGFSKVAVLKAEMKTITLIRLRAFTSCSSDFYDRHLVLSRIILSVNVPKCRRWFLRFRGLFFNLVLRILVKQDSESVE
ncbi:hypothetical protein WN51_01004 [Melipona quadrifasciata]|uniref:Uncharacterized protein n=1 Tax=Melipona quadrifasciata TaxID=166423 RepID=A0A0M8ZYE6_9HYME|nr:hypothetical protein WN51_01004 [Melipona quadrifasciata]